MHSAQKKSTLTNPLRINNLRMAHGRQCAIITRSYGMIKGKIKVDGRFVYFKHDMYHFTFLPLKTISDGAHISTLVTDKDHGSSFLKNNEIEDIVYTDVEFKPIVPVEQPQSKTKEPPRIVDFLLAFLTLGTIVYIALAFLSWDFAFFRTRDANILRALILGTVIGSISVNVK